MVSKQFVILIIFERIIVYIVLKLNIELYPRETRLLLGLTQFLLGGIQYIVLDMSTDIDTNVIAIEIRFFTEIEKCNCAYAICSLNLDYISVYAS